MPAKPSTVRTVALLHPRADRPHAPDYQRVLDTLNAAARRAVEDLGWRALDVPTADRSESAVHAMVAAADAIVLLGGEDVEPGFYGGATSYPGSGRHEPDADRTQIAVVRAAECARTPVLGLCRGHQLINVALGGTLVQHLPTLANHRAPEGSPGVYVEHRVVLDHGGAPHAEAPHGDALHRDVDARHAVRCTHHQAIDRLGAGLRVAARAHDGVIEAVVHESAPITGVQWHPEHPDTAPTQLTALLRRLDRQLRDAATHHHADALASTT